MDEEVRRWAVATSEGECDGGRVSHPRIWLSIEL